MSRIVELVDDLGVVEVTKDVIRELVEGLSGKEWAREVSRFGN